MSIFVFRLLCGDMPCGLSSHMLQHWMLLHAPFDSPAMQLRGLGHLHLHVPVHGLRGRARRSGDQVRWEDDQALLAAVHVLHEAYCGGWLFLAQLQAGDLRCNLEFSFF